jgi:glycosyltransferase involved in cell wall biosynthesis
MAECVIVHLTASPFFGGPERQMLGLARNLPSRYRSVFLCFAEHGLSRPFQEELRRHGFQSIELKQNTPHFFAAIDEVTENLRELDADILCCHGYKPDLLGWRAGRRLGIPVVAISRGWTWATAKVRIYESADRFCLRHVDRVVCVSEGQAQKVRRAGVSTDRVSVIHNAIDTDRFNESSPAHRDLLLQLFSKPLGRVVCAAGRLSPEKGFDVLIDAAAKVVGRDPNIGFVLFGEGPLRASLTQRIQAMNLQERFILPGFRKDLDQCISACDLLVQSSFTEGLPNVLLEAAAASVPVVATAVGGTPEVVENQITGLLVPSHDSFALADGILQVLQNETERKAMGVRSRCRVEEHFTFEAQSMKYQRLFDELTASSISKNT